MTVEQFQERLNKTMQTLVNDQMPDFFAQIVASDIIAAVDNRLTTKGVLASGEKPSYSTKPSLVGYPSDDMQQNYSKMYKKAYTTLTKNSNAKYVRIKVGNSKSKTATLVEVPGGYKQIRELGGYQTNHVDFTVSGEMLRSVKIKKTTVNGNKITITYGASGTEELKKLEGHNDRYNENILEPNAEELKAAKIRIQKQAIRLLNEGLFGQ